MPMLTARMMFLAAFACAVALSALPAAAQSATLAKIKRDQTIVLGYVAGAAPFSYADGNGQPQGYSVDLCRAVADSVGAQLGIAGLKTRWVLLTVQDRLEAVRSRRVDLECSTTSWTLQRQTLVDFSLITFMDGASVITLADSPARRIADFNDKRIAVLTGTTTEKALRETLARRLVKAEVVTVATREEGLRLVEEAKVDGLASDRTTLIGLVVTSQRRNRFKLLDEDFSVEPYALTLARDDHDFRLAVNRVLAGLYRGGGIQPIYDRWLGPLGAPSLLLSATYFIQGLSE
jgi:glutamate/aspartate transport system substrate-binding protein